MPHIQAQQVLGFQTTQKRAPKFRRDPLAVARKLITPRDWDILSIIESYPFLPSSLIVELAPGAGKRAYDHLKTLYHTGLASRFVFPYTVGNPGPFHYFIDSSHTINELADHKGWNHKKRALALQTAERYRKNGYSRLTDPKDSRDLANKMLYLKHEEMISRFHARLELACRASGGEVQLIGWAQGPMLCHKVVAPAIRYTKEQKRWKELDETESLPHEPDSYFVLYFPRRPTSAQYAHFLYEADRHRMNRTQMIRKFRAHYQYIVKRRLHRRDYGIERIRAVVVETTSEEWAKHLRTQAQKPIVSGLTPNQLFYFGSTRSQQGSERGVFDRHWMSTGDNNLWSLLDERPSRY